MSVHFVTGKLEDSTVRSPRDSSMLDTDSGDEAAKETRLLTNLQSGQNRSRPLDKGPMQEQADSDDARSYSSDPDGAKADENAGSADEAPAHKRSRVEPEASSAEDRVSEDS